MHSIWSILLMPFYPGLSEWVRDWLAGALALGLFVYWISPALWPGYDAP
jgi:hypothetical protein